MEVVSTYKKKISTLNNEQAAYVLGFVCLVLLGIFNSLIPFPFYWIGLGFFVYGLAVWVHQTAYILSSVIYVRALGALLLLAVTTFNLAFASSTVHSILEVPSSAFRYTITLVSVMLMPLSICILLAFVTFPLMPIAMLNSVFSLKNLSAKSVITLKVFSGVVKELSVTLVMGRMMACITLFYISSSFLSENGEYSEKIASITKSFAYTFEMEQHSYCKLLKDEKVAYLGGDLIVTGTYSNGSYTFSVTRCEKDL